MRSYYRSCQHIQRRSDETTDMALEFVGAGAEALTTFWTSPVLLECESMKKDVRQEAHTAPKRPLKKMLEEPLSLVPRPRAGAPEPAPF